MIYSNVLIQTETQQFTLTKSMLRRLISHYIKTSESQSPFEFSKFTLQNAIVLNVTELSFNLRINTKQILHFKTESSELTKQWVQHLENAAKLGIQDIYRYKTLIIFFFLTHIFGEKKYKANILKQKKY